MAQPAPGWMMLDRFVYRRDDEKDFPDKSRAPLRAKSCTSLGKEFEVALILADPPAISRFYVRWPEGTKPEEGGGAELVDTNHDLILLRLTSVQKLADYPYVQYHQDHFVVIGKSKPKPRLELIHLPQQATELVIPRHEEDEETEIARVFFPKTVGIARKLANEDAREQIQKKWTANLADDSAEDSGKDSAKDEFVVSQLARVSKSPELPRKMHAEICFLHSCGSDMNWEVRKLPIQHEDNDYNDLWHWSTDDVVTFGNYIFWVDYFRGGMLFYNPFEENPALSYCRLMISNPPTGAAQCRTFPEMTRSLCVSTYIDKKGNKVNHVLRFIDISRSDGCVLGPLKLGSGFTIKLSTLWALDMNWTEPSSITSGSLWKAEGLSQLPHSMLMFPLVSMENYTTYFLVSHDTQEEETTKVSLVTIDISPVEEKVEEKVEVTPYVKEGEDTDMIEEKKHMLQGFLSSRFPSFLTPSSPGTRKWLTKKKRSVEQGKAGGSGTK